MYRPRPLNARLAAHQCQTASICPVVPIAASPRRHASGIFAVFYGTARSPKRLTHRHTDEVHRQARDESEYLQESQMGSPDPAMACPVLNYRQHDALNALERLSSPKSLKTLDALAQEAKDPNIRTRAAAVAAAIRKM